MKKFARYLVVIFLCMNNIVQAQITQMDHWYINQYSNSVDVDFGNTPSSTSPYNIYDYLVTDLPTPTSGYTHKEGAVNGMYDMTGDLIFYIEDGTVFDKNGVNKGTFQYTGNKNTNEIAIIPFKNTCLKYYVVISTLPTSSSQARVLYGKVTLDENYNVTSITNEGLLGGYSTNVNVSACSFAVSNSINSEGDKYLYLVEGSNYLNTSYYGYLKRFLLTDNGITYQQTILDGSVAGQKLEYVPLEVELSHDGTQLAWGSSFSYETCIYYVDLVLETIHKCSTNVTGYPHGVEYSPDGTKLFFTQSGGVYNVNYIDFNNNNQVINVPNTGSGFSSHIELGPDGQLYTISGSINPNTLAINEKIIPFSIHSIGGVFHTVSTLPDQIDGFDYYDTEHIKTCCAESYPYISTQSIGIVNSAIWTANFNPFQLSSSTISMEEGVYYRAGCNSRNTRYEF